MERHHDLLSAFQELLRTWAAGARDREIERAILTLTEELRRRGVEIRCEVTRSER